MNNKNIKQELDKLNEEYRGDDRFLGKDILTFANQLNSSRNIMFNSHLEQYVVLKNPDFPRVFTNYENEVGSYSSSYLRNDSKKEVVAKVTKYTGDYKNLYYVLITKDSEGIYDVIYRKPGETLTESYVYLYNNDVIDEKEEGQTLEKDELLYRSTSFDEYGNFRYGKNANVCFMIEDNTIEDAIHCSESFAEAMTSHYLTEVEVSVNNNDLLLNLYGDNDDYKCFPDIGEYIKDQKLACRRRINYQTALFDLQTENLKRVNYNGDTIFYQEGQVIDIEIRSNKSVLDLAKSVYNKQIVKYITMEHEYYTKLYDILKPIIDNGKFTHELSYLFRQVDDYLVIYNDAGKEKSSGETIHKWESEKSEFDNFIITFKVLTKNKLKIGSKLSGRFGNKGVISKISPDNEMPVTSNGKRADVIMNALGVSNRLNNGQLIEHELNFISDEIIEKAKTLPSNDSKLKFILSFVKDVNEEQFKQMLEYVRISSPDERKEFLQDILDNGLYLHQPPFWNNVNFDKLCELYDKYNWIKPYDVYINNVKIEKPLIIAPMYLLKLKHDSSSKYSARNVSYLNAKNIPSKNLYYKKKQALCANTPIRWGEMEVSNGLITLMPDEVERLLSMYASSEYNRHNTVKTLLTAPNPTDIKRIDTIKENHNREILNSFFKCAALELVDVSEEDTE